MSFNRILVGLAGIFGACGIALSATAAHAGGVRRG